MHFLKILFLFQKYFFCVNLAVGRGFVVWLIECFLKLSPEVLVPVLLLVVLLRLMMMVIW